MPLDSLMYFFSIVGTGSLNQCAEPLHSRARATQPRLSLSRFSINVIIHIHLFIMSLFRFIEIHSCILGLFLGKNKKYLDGFNTIDANVRVEFRRINERRVRVEIWYHKGAQPFENVQDRLGIAAAALDRP
jgi:hypothetical protein